MPLLGGKIEEHDLIDDLELFVRYFLCETTKNGQSMLVEIHRCGHVSHGHNHVLAIRYRLYPCHSLQVECEKLVGYFLSVHWERVPSKDVHLVAINCGGVAQTR